MAQCWLNSKVAEQSTSSADSDPQHSLHAGLRSRNVYELLELREISPRIRNSSKRFWHQTAKLTTDGYGQRQIDPKQALFSWVEGNSLRNLSAKYSPLLPPPRSTIAAAFSLDGKTLASTHGDHTVKIIDCQSGNCLKVLSGHRRTPWVVRFHPLHTEILASGSLDHEVRLWDSHTATCIGSHDFYRPIASIAFHAQGQILAVASGHKLFMWHYNNGRGESSSPTSVLKTKRSLRTVHFHPHAAPLLLTAEVNDLDSPDYPLTLATTPGYPQYPPAVIFTNATYSNIAEDEATMPLMPPPYLFWPTILRDGGQNLQQFGMLSGSVDLQHEYSNMGHQHNVLATPMDVSLDPHSSNPAMEPIANYSVSQMELTTAYSGIQDMENINGQQIIPNQHSNSTGVIQRMDAIHRGESSSFPLSSVSTRLPSSFLVPGVESTVAINSLGFSGGTGQGMPLSTPDGCLLHQYIPFSDLASWRLPFLQGWVMGQTHASLPTMLPISSGLRGPLDHRSGSELVAPDLPLMHRMGTILGPSASATTVSQPWDNGRNSSRHRSRSRPTLSEDTGEAAAELPCTVKLRIWHHDIQVPCAPLGPDRCLLTIPHAVLCSEMGAHFSPCGRFLAACVACVLPQLEGDQGLLSQMTADSFGAASSPTRHPLSAQKIIYELRIYSLEEASFGVVLASKAIRAAHCLTSIQFSPTSEHLLLAYGRRHSSLRWRRAIETDATMHTYTIMEIYRVPDMELVKVLPSADDEVNVACFHPLPGGGLVYGTKEGRLRIFQYDGTYGINCSQPSRPSQPNSSFEDNLRKVQRFALEC